MIRLIKKILKFVAIVIFCTSVHSQSKKIELQGTVIDQSKYPIPYAAVGVPSKYIGSASTEDGEFYILISEKNLLDTLEISSMGYKTFKIQIQDFVKKENKIIALEEDIVSLSEATIFKPSSYVTNAFKNLKNTTLSKPHQLKILYRRFSGEDNLARFFVEHYLTVVDKGPISSSFRNVRVVEGRKSADYRFIKKKQPGHAVNYMLTNNPLRRNIAVKDFKWKKTGDTSYNNEDVLIIEGKKRGGHFRHIKFYIGVETFSVYKIETFAPWIKTIYIYKKDKNGKLYLSYHNRHLTVKKDLTDHQKKLLGFKTDKINVSYRHEAYVIGLETDKKSLNFKPYGGTGSDIGDVKLKPNPIFWRNISIPPESKFYKKNVKEIESVFGVPLETQFRIVNK